MSFAVSRMARPWLPVGLIWALLAAALLSRGWGFVTSGATYDPDAVMRMLQIEDLLGGQGWFDLHQYRIGPPGGVAMHWSRIADLLPAGLTLLLTPVAGSVRALVLAQAVTPLLLLLPAIAASFAVARALVPGRAVAVPLAIVLATSLAALTPFAPGDVDHHNLQLVAVLMLLAGACARPSVGAGVLAGVAVTLAMTIGLETAPHVAAVLGAVALRWVVAPDREQSFVRGLGISQVASALVSLAVFMPRRWPAGQCDSWTPAAFWVVAGSGALFVVAGIATPRTRTARLALLVAGAIVLLGLVAFAYPACLHHPAGDDPLLWRYWMNGITENEAVTAMVAHGEWGRAALNLGSAPLVLIIGGWVALRSDAPRAWSPALAAGAAALVVTLLHVRGQALLWGVAAPLAAALIARARIFGGWRAIAAWLTLPPLALMLVVAAFAPAEHGPSLDKQRACYAPHVIAALNRLPPATLVVPITAEPMILARTRHRSLGATYHRNARGNHLLIAAMLAAPDDARAPLIEGGARYLLYCPGFDISGVYRRGSPHGLAAALTADRAPAWLQPLARLPGDVRLYAIR